MQLASFSSLPRMTPAGEVTCPLMTLTTSAQLFQCCGLPGLTSTKGVVDRPGDRVKAAFDIDVEFLDELANRTRSVPKPFKDLGVAYAPAANERSEVVGQPPGQRGVVHVVMGGQDVADRLAVERVQERLQVDIVIGPRVHDRHHAATDQERAGARIREGSWITRHNAPKPRRKGLDHPILEIEGSIEWDHTATAVVARSSIERKAAASRRVARILSRNGRAKGGMSVLLTSTT